MCFKTERKGNMELDKVLGDRFTSVRVPGWEQFGTRLDAPSGATEALDKAGLDYEVRLSPVQYSATADGGIIGDLRVMKNKFVIWHDNTEMGIVGTDYHPIQNSVLASILDPITEVYPVETIGGSHDALFFAMNAGEVNVNGELLKMYFTAVNFHGGGRSLRMMFTPIRFACINMLHTGLAASIVNVALAHYEKAVSDLRLRVELLRKMKKAQQDTLDTFVRLGTIAMNAKSIARVLEEVYPYRPMPKKVAVMEDVQLDTDEALEFNGLVEAALNIKERWEWEKTRVDAFRSSAKLLYDRFNDEYPKVAGTGYALFNAVVELADWRAGSGDVGWDALYSKRAQEKSRAFTAISKLD